MVAMSLDISELEKMIEELEVSEQHQSNCMLQLSLMVARLALSQISEDFKDDASQTMLELIRAKRKSAPVVTHTRFNPEHRKPWVADVHTSPMPPMPSALSVNSKFGGGGLS